MFDSGTTSRGFVEMRAMPFVAVAAADARQVRTGALGAELERMVVDALAGQRIVAVTLGLGAQRPDHLRVAVVATLADVDVAAFERQRRVGLHAGRRRRDLVRQVQRHDLHQAADG